MRIYNLIKKAVNEYPESNKSWWNIGGKLGQWVGNRIFQNYVQTQPFHHRVGALKDFTANPKIGTFTTDKDLQVGDNIIPKGTSYKYIISPGTQEWTTFNGKKVTVPQDINIGKQIGDRYFDFLKGYPQDKTEEQVVRAVFGDQYADERKKFYSTLTQDKLDKLDSTLIAPDSSKPDNPISRLAKKVFGPSTIKFLPIQHSWKAAYSPMTGDVMVNLDADKVPQPELSSLNNTDTNIGFSNNSIVNHPQFSPGESASRGLGAGHQITHAAQVNDYDSPRLSSKVDQNRDQLQTLMWPLHYNRKIDIYAIFPWQQSQSIASFNRSRYMLAKQMKQNKQKFLDAGYTPEQIETVTNMPMFFEPTPQGRAAFINSMQTFAKDPVLARSLGEQGMRAVASYADLIYGLKDPRISPQQKVEIQSALDRFINYRIFANNNSYNRSKYGTV